MRINSILCRIYALVHIWIYHIDQLLSMTWDIQVLYTVEVRSTVIPANRLWFLHFFLCNFLMTNAINVGGTIGKLPKFSHNLERYKTFRQNCGHFYWILRFQQPFPTTFQSVPWLIVKNGQFWFILWMNSIMRLGSTDRCLTNNRSFTVTS